MKLTDLPVDRPVATVMFLVALVVVGGVSIFRLPLAFWPTLEEPEVEVQVPFFGDHPVEGLREIAEPLEEELAALPGLRRMESHVGGGNVEIDVWFDPSENVDLKKMEVREAVERIRHRLPSNVGFIRVSGSVHGGVNDGGAILQGRISADRNLSESWNLLDRHIARPLERIKGVARVHLYGVDPQEVRVDFDLDAIRGHGLHPGEVVAALQAANLDLDLGTLRGDLLSYGVRSLARFRDLDAVRDLRVGAGNVRIRDLARVELREPRQPLGRHLDRKFAIGIDVYKEPGANTVEIHDRIMERVASFDRDPELEGVALLVWESAGARIRTSIEGLRNAGLFGGLLAIAVLYLFLRRLSTTLVIAVAIPFSILVTCAAMMLVGTELNLLTMVGLMMGVGMMVDNAVVVLENIHRLEGTGVPAREAAREGAQDVALAVVAATATTLIVWSWLLFEDPSEMTVQVGAAALPICLAVSCSLLISLTFIPLAASRFAPMKKVRPGFVLSQVVPRYRKLLGWTFRHRFLTLVGLLVMAATAAYPIAVIEKVGEPKTVRRVVIINYEVHDPATKEVLEGHVDQVEGWVEARRDDLGYESLYSWYDERGSTGTAVYLAEDGLTESAIRDLRTKLQDGLPTLPGVRLSVLGDRWWDRGGAQGRRLVNVALHGADPEYLEVLARDLEDRMRSIRDVTEVFGPSLRGRQEARVIVDPDRARALGVSPAEIAQSVGFAFQGVRLRRYQGPDGEIELIAGVPDHVLPGLSTLADLPIPLEGGGATPLSSVASVDLTRTPPRIFRTDRITTSWMTVQFDEEAVPNTSEATDRVAAFMDSTDLPDGYAWSWGQWGRNRDDSLETMFRGVMLSLLIVVLLMMALFESFTQPLAIVITLPLAFFGGFWALWIFGHVLDPVAFFGVILLIGIVVNNGIVMVNHVNTLRRRGSERVPALVQGCGDRLRPVMMTAITTICGLVPLGMSAFNVRGASLASMTTVIAGGLATSTLFTLIGLPVWYTMVEDLGSVARRLLPRWSGAAPASSGAGTVARGRH